MTSPPHADFPEHAFDNRRVWDANAGWWDDRIGDGNEFQTWLIEPATERLLAPAPGDTVLDVACGAGRMARRIAASGARVVAFDASAAFVARARERTPADAGIEYHVADAASPDALLALGANRFDKAVCTMALMDMPEIEPLFATLPRLLVPGGTFVFSILHPCYLSAPGARVAEIEDDQTGRGVLRSAVKVWSYLTPSARRTEGISGQPEPHWCFHRPLSTLFGVGFAAGFAIEGLEEPRLPDPPPGSGLSWRDAPDIPPILAVRMRRGLASDTMGPAMPAAR
jgi:ubiquinone/menaquinone biosynthesis C-methylase UbiE